MHPELYNQQKVEPEQYLSAQIGPLELWIRHTGDEFHVAVKRNAHSENVIETSHPEPVKDTPDACLSWSRWVVGQNFDTMQLLPVMPDRPVVVRPATPVSIPTGNEALFFVAVPIWVDISVFGPAKVTLLQAPSVVLSDTWFGDPMTGELCYSMRTRARRKVSDSPVRPHRVLCPVLIRNTTTEQLDVERFCVHIQNLTVYAGQSRLWTNEVRISFRGENETSQVKYVESAPEYEHIDRLLSNPRAPQKKTLLQRSFSTFRLFGGEGE